MVLDINEDFVSFDLAKKLKEKGFEWDCYTTFDGVGYTTHFCPTISQVLKWLREEKNLYVEVLLSMRGGWYNIIYEIAPRRGFDLKHMLIEEKSYEDAAIAGIEYVIDNLI